MTKSQTVNEYINRFPKETKEKLLVLKRVIKEVMPSAEEAISYGIPVFKINGTYVVYIAGFKNHVSIYPVTEELPKDLTKILDYKKGAGTIQFKLTDKLPLTLIKKFVAFRSKKVEENFKKTS